MDFTYIDTLVWQIQKFYDYKIPDNYASVMAEYYTVREITEFNELRKVV